MSKCYIRIKSFNFTDADDLWFEQRPTTHEILTSICKHYQYCDISYGKVGSELNYCSNSTAISLYYCHALIGKVNWFEFFRHFKNVDTLLEISFALAVTLLPKRGINKRRGFHNFVTILTEKFER